jgi:hypothetical protein
MNTLEAGQEKSKSCEKSHQCKRCGVLWFTEDAEKVMAQLQRLREINAELLETLEWLKRGHMAECKPIGNGCHCGPLLRDKASAIIAKAKASQT